MSARRKSPSSIAAFLAIGFVAALPSASQAGAGLACGSVVPAGQTVTLTANVGPCDNTPGTPAITVESGATLDLAGFSVQCVTPGPAAGDPRGFSIPPATGILLEGSGATVTAGIVSGCLGGVTVGGTGKHEVTAMTVTNDQADAVYVRPGSEKNKLSAITVTGAFGECFQIDGDKNKLSDSHAVTCLDGIEVDGAKNKVSGCTVADSDDGFDIDGDSNKLLGNEATGNMQGYAVGGDRNKIIGNLADENVRYGFEIDGSSKVTGNTATGNGGTGILVSASSDTKVKVQKNTATGNATLDPGFDLEDATAGCGAHGWKKNVFGTASDPCIQ